MVIVEVEVRESAVSITPTLTLDIACIDQSHLYNTHIFEQVPENLDLFEAYDAAESDVLSHQCLLLFSANLSKCLRFSFRSRFRMPQRATC
jgi:hypothetical protein